MLNDLERKLIVRFLDQYAADDVLMQAAFRTQQYLEGKEDLREFINKWPRTAPLHAGDYVGTKDKSKTQTLREPDPDYPPEPEFDPVIDYEDLGEPAGKLGTNGQAIEKLLQKKSESSLTIKQIGAELKLPASKIAPMLALLIERTKVVRIGSNKYQISPP